MQMQMMTQQMQMQLTAAVAVDTAVDMLAEVLMVLAFVATELVGASDPA